MKDTSFTDLMEDKESLCLKILKQIRPHWDKSDIILWNLGERSWAGYSIENIQDKLFIKLWENEAQVLEDLRNFKTDLKIFIEM